MGDLPWSGFSDQGIFLRSWGGVSDGSDCAKY
jgi:hypothetical protein